MLTGRLLLMLVVMTATLAHGRPALASPMEPAIVAAERTAWVQRLGTGVTRTFSRIGLLQRVTLRVPSPRLITADPHTTRPAVVVAPDPLRTCLPPPIAC